MARDCISTCSRPVREAGSSGSWSTAGAGTSDSAARQLVPLADAREKALVYRRMAREGGDPLAEKRRLASMPTFADAALRVLEQKRAGWREGRHPQSWWTSLERHAFPRIGARVRFQR